ncbi:hypothetical protein RchiOBHm_Chr2g0155761 [Rosa chinensis]|uniref:Uncharacterized protein n=1 Tax=Rosa chinensis TaxID=74649 RepID=A0A2P6S1B9_ROSCH|nr:hypothetical protein RchiOBHm_Chr2g0155761 [Rosa chinensis]
MPGSIGLCRYGGGRRESMIYGGGHLWQGISKTSGGVAMAVFDRLVWRRGVGGLG